MSDIFQPNQPSPFDEKKKEILDSVNQGRARKIGKMKSPFASYEVKKRRNFLLALGAGVLVASAFTYAFYHYNFSLNIIIIGSALAGIFTFFLCYTFLSR